MDDPHTRYIPPTDEEMEAFMAEQYRTQEPPTKIGGNDIDERRAAQIINGLTVPFRRDQISQRKIGGRMLDYVEGHEYISRLNEASPAWSFRITKSETTMLHVTRYDKQRQPNQVELPCLTVYGELTIPGVGTRSGIGVQMIEDNAGEDVMKGALTDSLKNCAKYFGLGLHMYSGDTPAAPQRAERPPQAPAPQRQQNAPQQANTQASGASGGKRALEDPPTDVQKRALWKISGASRDTIAEWCAEIGVASERDLTSAQAGEIITKYGNQQ